ncbi:hypothetical protein [Methylobacterium gregans]|uniref:Transmembrane protein n=1 Tax=Methylobacterium gregans TaxID=374424 RepID=A0AA37HMQ9_9HYPH|nr:hypothetical protein [Methylobacterium gregans]MDQ0520735.1 hypothetical protein [Methylobacterium gregans]GJD78369.1 hypothetical protein NBEOAGPD_1583 [Methylobacterium gregans]GLS53316.1 hypothetical protein GCM10007886_14990 [Methylobacterium gregans]
MSRFMTLALAGVTALGTSVGAVQTAQAAPLPALSGHQVGGANTAVDHVGWRRGYYGGGYGWRGGYGGYGYRGYGYRRNVGGALAAGAALGLIGGAIAASAAPRYGYYGGGYGYGYPAYGYAPVGYGYGYGYPAYGGYYGYGW